MKPATLAAWILCTGLAGPALAQSGYNANMTPPSGSDMRMDGEHSSAPLYYFFRANRLDYGASQEGARGAWDIDARVGTDEHRLVLKSEGEYIKGKGQNAEVQLLYSRPISEFWDVQIGGRQSYLPIGRSYFALGVQGVLPGFIDTEATLFISNKGQASARVKAEMDLPWTGQIYSRPSIEVNAYASDDRAAETYSGIGSVKLAIQTRYQLTRQVAPYIELGWERSLGRTATAVRAAGERVENAYAVIGLRLLY